MAGKRQKHPDALAFRRAGRYRPLMVAEGEPPVQPCPGGVVPRAKEAWERLWQSPLRRAYEDSDLPALFRWLWWYDQWLRTAEQISQTGPTRRGARGDVVLRSSVRFLNACEAALQSLEESLGLTPLARMRLGLVFSNGPSALELLRAPAQPMPFGERDPGRLLHQEGGGA
jgi:P27 family predicted phage terminase small subunit